MRIGIAAPLSLAAVNGGVRTQILKTSEHLKQLGISVEIIHSDHVHFDFDLVHIFSSSPETIGIAKQVKNKGIPLAVSPVFFANRTAKSIRNILKVEKLLSKLGTGIRSEYGIKAEICHLADILLPNTIQEKELVRDAFDIAESRFTVVPNGVESRFAHATPELFEQKYKLKDFVLFVGQAGAARKNVIQLLRIAPKIDREVVIIGDFYSDTYSDECLSLAKNSNNIHLIPTLAHTDPLLESAYAACDIFCLPSFFETPGIAAMEAALTNAKVVITKYGGTKEYFRDMATYTDPNSDQSLLDGITKALSEQKSDKLKNYILEYYTWEKVAEKTAEAYSTML
ncbi:MAG: glycosyltransferase family 4 protein [bacterium]|nr:glycosyltransferase family 4 protein [bacterium]